MIKKLFILFICLPAITVFTGRAQAIAAAPLTIELNKQQFKQDEEIKTKVVFTNTLDKPVTGQILCDLMYAANPELYPPGPQNQQFDLKPGAQVVMNCSNSATAGMPEGIYHMNVEVWDEHHNVMISDFKELLIAGIEQAIQSEMQICADSACQNPKVVFMAGEDVNISLRASEYNPTITAQLLNNKREKLSDLQFTNNQAKIKADKTGGYIVTATLSQAGKIPQTIEKDFAVIDGPAQIKTITECNGNGKCETGENIQNCPQDCTPVKVGLGYLKYLIIIFVIIFILALAGIFYYLIKKRQRNRENNNINSIN